MDDRNENYLSVLSGNHTPQSTMSDAQLHDFNQQLWLLLGQQTERYTMGDSDSIPTAVAKRLLQSIYYCMAIYQESNDQPTAQQQNQTVNVQEIFSLGLAKTARQITIGKTLLRKAAANLLRIDNDYYQDVLSQASFFFKQYDYRFFAQENPIQIDYPLCHNTQKQQGVQYINQYLSAFIIENEFCENFNTDIIYALLEAYAADYQSQLISIYEPVANNALALTLLQADVFSLDVHKADCVRLTDHLLSMPHDAAMTLLVDAAEALCSQLGIVKASAIAYTRKTAIALLGRIEATGGTRSYEGIFYPLHRIQAKKLEQSQYMDSDLMDDEALRDLLDEISDCEQVSDKIALVKEHIHSLRDLTEVLSISFWDDECRALFATFSMATIATLLHFISKNQAAFPSWQSETRWEIHLLTYVEQMNEPQRLEVLSLAEKLV